MVANRSHFSFPLSRLCCVPKAGGFHPARSDGPLLYIMRKNLSASKELWSHLASALDVICIACVED